MKVLIKIIRYLVPPPEWRLAVIVLLGVFCGLGAYIIRISNAVSYLSEDPKACMNCHVMSPQYATWQRSSHMRVTCVDCHVPHDNIFHKYEFKAKDGTRHATIFTLRTEPQVIRMKQEAFAVVQENCIRCHTDVLQDTSLSGHAYPKQGSGSVEYCWKCHRETPHGRVRSLSAVPYAQVPQLPSVVPDWMKKFLTERPSEPQNRQEVKNEASH